MAWLKNKPKCFVAGTLVHTVEGTKPIEEVTTADQVWAFDRQTQQWRLCPVVQTFERRSDLLTHLTLDDGTELTGTVGHPFWVIEGEGLAGRTVGDHGHDETPGPTPGRWVAMSALAVGDVVLTRAGQVARVVVLETWTEAVPVYNLTVEGLHSYAVGTAGALVHNADPADYAGAAKATTKAAATAPPTDPSVPAPKAGQAPASPAGPGGGKATSPTAPADGMPQPSTTGVVRTDPKTSRPRSNSDPRVTHKFEVAERTLPDGTKTTKPLHVEAKSTSALDAEVASYNAARAQGTADGENLGNVGAAQYMEQELGATRVPKPANTAGGQYDLDQVYQKGDTFYIVEAKGPKSTTTTRQVPGETVPFQGDVVPAHAIQGNRTYLNLTLDSMATPGSPTEEIALQLKDALEQGKVVYLQVRTVARPNGSAYFSVKQFNLPEPP
ncbi:MAG: hypothetical protein LC104_13930 [Bacteroidales bacterium]|nr:hypothetical protein [Bacteroidales bacterium]